MVLLIVPNTWKDSTGLAPIKWFFDSKCAGTRISTEADLSHLDIMMLPKCDGFHWQYHNIFSLKQEAWFWGMLATKKADII